MSYRNDDVKIYENKPEIIDFSYPYLSLCYYYDYDKIQHLEYSNKIILPINILETLSKYENITSPYSFYLMTDTGSTICGVYEFVIGIDHIYIPQCVLEKIQFKHNINKNNIDTIQNSTDNNVTIRYIDKSFEKGTKLTIQPHTSNFLELENPKEYLEYYLNHYTLLEKGTTIVLPDPDYIDNIYFNIIETQPNLIISTINTDLEVEFKAPLDYKEPVVNNQVVDETNKNDENKKNTKHPNHEKIFIPFSGKGCRLGGDDK